MDTANCNPSVRRMTHHRMQFDRSGRAEPCIRFSPADSGTAELAASLGFTRQPSGFYDLELGYAHRAAALWPFGDDKVKAYLQVAQTNHMRSYAETPVTGLPTPSMPKGIELYPYQVAAVQAAMGNRWTSFNHRVGIGKSPMALGLLNHIRPYRTVIICPRFLVANWERELRKFVTHRYRVISMVQRKMAVPTGSCIVILPMSRAAAFHYAMLRSESFDFGIVDESQYFKNSVDGGSVSARARAVWGNSSIEGIVSRVSQGVDLSATPSPNAPTELYAKLAAVGQHVLAGRSFPQFRDTTTIMAEGQHGDFAVAVKNPDALRMDLRATGFMIRPRVSTPPPVWNLVALNASGSVQAKLAEENRLHSAWKKGALLPRGEIAELEGHLMTIRRELGIAKVPDLAAYADQLMTSMDRLVVFVWHREVCEKLKETMQRRGFGLTDIIYGGTPPDRKDKILQNFISPRARKRIIIAQIQAAGAGINEMVAANHMIIGELPWTSADVEQVVGRLTRVTQKKEVFVHMLAFPGSVEDANLRRIQDKAVMSSEIYG